MQRIMEDIRTGQFSNVYLLYGEEDYLRRQFRDKLKTALVNTDDVMNYQHFEGKDIATGKLIDLAETMPFLSDRRVIVVENSGFFKSSEEELAQYIKEICSTTYIIFSESEVDKRNKMYKAVQAAGCVSEFGVQDENTLKRWILGMLKKENLQISERAMGLFLEKTGTDMEVISRELEKVICYAMGRDAILPEDVEIMCTPQIGNHIFDMIRAVSEGRRGEALNLYYDLLALKEPPMRILFLLAKQFDSIMQVKELKGRNYDNKVIAEKLGIAPFLANRYASQSGGFTREALRRAVEACVTAEEDVKTGKLVDRLSVELLIIQLSSREERK